MSAVRHETLLAAQRIAAQIVARDGPAFIPVFQRLEAEIEASGARGACLARAVDLAAREGG
ncbi:MAG: hypothetical protein ACK5MY_15680 [Jhaorihella sp.]